MPDQLAISGGTPVRSTESNPWSRWPLTTTEEWESKVEPLLREVYLSANEGSGGTMTKRLGIQLSLSGILHRVPVRSLQ